MLLSIVVLSYNRPEQVERILKNFIGVQVSDFNIIIKDDLSPKLPEITSVIKKYAGRLEIEVVLHVNQKNMGYDKNLLDSFIVVDSEYLLLLSDDDYINGTHVSMLLSILSKREFHVYFTPYTEGDIIKREIDYTYDMKRFSDVVYNSILFSGLIIDRLAVCSLKLNYEFISDCIYSQVYLVSLLVYQQGGYGVMPAGILYLGGDGENFFGKNASAKNSTLLSDRKSIDADLKYQKLLLRVVDEISENTSHHIKNMFMREYRKRLVGYGLRARSYGVQTYIKFFLSCVMSDGQVRLYSLIILFMIIFMPAFFSKKIYDVGVGYCRKSG